MQEDSKRRVLTRRNAVVMAGSLHRSKLKMDEGKGETNVFNGKESHKNDGSVDDERARGCRRLRGNQRDSIATERRRPSNCRSSQMEENSCTQRSIVKIRKAPKSLRKDHLEIEGQKQLLLVGDSIEGDEEGKIEKIGSEIKQGELDLVDKMMDLPEEKSIAMNEEEEEEEEEEEDDGEQIIDQKLGIHVLSQDEEKDMNPVSMPISMNAAEERQNHMIPSHLDGETKARASHEHNGIQSIVNLAMWRNASKSAFVFGCGTFFLLSSSYANDINFSLISACSYVGLFYLAFVFLCKSIIRRGDTGEINERDEYMVGEEEAIWLLKLLLPYVNELLLLLRSLFSGHPATTMKLALLLFVTARCGSCITIWSLAKLTFYGAFTIPKLYSAYSTQLANFGKFWVERVKDGWESCGNKRAVASAIFVFVWNISSTVARIWTLFMAVVVLKLYQQAPAECGWSGQEEEAGREDQLGLGSRRRREENRVIKSGRFERRGWKEIKVDVSS